MFNLSEEEEKEYAASINKFGYQFVSYFNIISSSIGIPCNIISIFIFARLMRNKNNMGFLYVWQCSIDLLVVLFFLLIYRSSRTLGIDIITRNDAGCKLVSILSHQIVQVSSWIAVVTTFDRFTFVLYGHGNRFRFLKSKRNLTFIILAIFTTIFVLNVPNFFFNVSRIDNQCSGENWAQIVIHIVSICLRTYFPLVIMLVFNIAMIRHIVKKKRNFSSRQSRKESQFTFAVIAYNFYFFVLNSPLSIYYILNDINLNSIVSKESLLYSFFNLAYIFTADLAFCEQTFSFFMYFACNRLFRNELLHIIGRIFHIQNLSDSLSLRNNPIPNSQY